MRIHDIKINGVSKPIGFRLPYLDVGWKVDETENKAQQRSRVELWQGDHFLWQKEGVLDCNAEAIEHLLSPRTDYTVRITVWGDHGDCASEETSFFTGKKHEPWQAEWIGTAEQDTFHPLFCKHFSVKEKPVAQARLYLCGLGLFEAYLNDEKVGDEYLTPYYNNYNYEQQVMAYDVTHLIHKSNRLNVILGNGWYKGRFGINRREIYGNRFALIAELYLCYSDGSCEIVKTDDSWQYKGSDIEASDIYDGEVFNRLLWQAKENAWQPARVLPLPKQTLTDRYSLPVHVMETLPVRQVLHTPAGETVLDMGQNFAGWIQFESDRPCGAKITLDFGEVLQDGNFYRENYRTAKSQFVYISDGRTETVRPHFTYFGFRYVRVSGWDGELDPTRFVGCVLYSDMERTGSFTCDNEKLNRLYENTIWGMKSNFIDMPTDCPQRDERLGWTGDAQLFAPTASLHMDTRAFYEKFLHDLRHYQAELNGGIPVCIPETDSCGMHMTSAAWSDVATILPMALYKTSGDIYLLRHWYPMMRDWVDYVTAECEKQGKDHYLWNFSFHFGDWLALDGKDENACQGGTEEYFISSVYYYHSTYLTSRAAAILAESGKLSLQERSSYHEQAEHYKMRANLIRTAILDEYFTPSGRLAIDTQTAYLLALRYEVYRDAETVKNQLVKRFEKDNFCIKSGFVGAPVLCQTLCENGMQELAWFFLLNEKYPSWLYCVNLGATTVWERWNSILPDGHINSAGMNSLNHYSYGSVAQFLYENAAGIRCAVPGYKKVVFQPEITGQLRHVSAAYDSPQGRYALEWTLEEDGTVVICCEVPFGGSAVLRAPRCETAEIALEAGTFTLRYTPHASFLKRFTGESLMKQILNDPKGAAYIAQKAPVLSNMCEMGGDGCKALKLNELLGVAMQMLGMPAQEAERIKTEIEQL